MKDAVNEKIQDYFDQVCAFMESSIKEGDRVLVHCAFGVSRSSTLVIAYLMKKLKIGMVEALSYVRRKRPTIKPNAGFM